MKRVKIIMLVFWSVVCFPIEGGDFPSPLEIVPESQTTRQIVGHTYINGERVLVKKVTTTHYYTSYESKGTKYTKTLR